MHIKNLIRKLLICFDLQSLLKYYKKLPFSEQYWIERYAKGKNSGLGSYGKFAIFKAEIINDFVRQNDINKVIEYGCGDGNQLEKLIFKKYSGFDVSPKAISLCRQKFHEDNTKQFKLMKDYNNETADLTISLDVIYHLVEDRVFEAYMSRLFSSSSRYVIIYSTNFKEQLEGPYIRHREFTDWVKKNWKQWQLVKVIPNKYPFTGDEKTGCRTDFFIYEKTLK